MVGCKLCSGNLFSFTIFLQILLLGGRIQGTGIEGTGSTSKTFLSPALIGNICALTGRHLD